ncbi:hypothetical protein QMP26_41855 (plasmid) [Enterocloster clostridioformis]
MKKSKLTVFIFIAFLIIVFYLGILVVEGREKQNCIVSISIEDYHKYLNDKASFILVVERPSCRYCAIVTSAVHQIKNSSLPIYLMDLEPYWGTEEYDLIKSELQVNYLPTFKYIEDGNIKYNMNSPLDTGYYEAAGEQRSKLYHEMEDKIQKFMQGAAGKGPVVNEPLLQDLTIQGVSESKETE